MSSLLLVVLVCCCLSGFRTFKPETRRWSSPSQRLYVLPALLPEKYDPIAIDRYFSANPTLIFQRTSEIVSQFAWLMVECVGELVLPPLEKQDMYDKELEGVSNAEYPPRLVDMLLGYNYMAVYGYGNEGKVEKSNKFSLLARCTARLRRVLIGLGPSFIKIGQVSFSLSSYYRYDAYIIL